MGKGKTKKSPNTISQAADVAAENLEVRNKREQLLIEIKKQLAQREKSAPNHSKAAIDVLAHLSYLAWHCHKYATIPSFLDAIRSDIVAMLYAFAAGLERSAYLHARSLLENLLRHCYYDAHPTAFAIQQLKREEDIQESWSKVLMLQVPTLPHFMAIDTKTREKVFERIQEDYKNACRFVHGSTYRYRSNYDGIGSIDMNEEQTAEIGKLLQSVGESGLILLALVHVGPYMLISQPIRQYMMRSMGNDARELFLRCMQQIPIPWAKHQRNAALDVLRQRQSARLHTPDGLLREEDHVFLMKPYRS